MLGSHTSYINLDGLHMQLVYLLFLWIPIEISGLLLGGHIHQHNLNPNCAVFYALYKDEKLIRYEENYPNSQRIIYTFALFIHVKNR